MQNFKNVFVPQHILVSHNLALMRDKNSSRETFLNAFKNLSTVLVQEGLSFLPKKEVEIETPLSKMKTKVIDSSYSYIIMPILRAGLALTETMVDFLPQAHVMHIGMYRNEETHQPIWYYDKTPEQFSKNTKVFLLDPMLATGGSALACLDLLVKKQVLIENIVFVSVISAPEGINKVHQKYPDLKIITGAIDEKLNENAYIVPGLGDAGDRYFNSVIA